MELESRSWIIPQTILSGIFSLEVKSQLEVLRRSYELASGLLRNSGDRAGKLAVFYCDILLCSIGFEVFHRILLRDAPKLMIPSLNILVNKLQPAFPLVLRKLSFQGFYFGLYLLRMQSKY